MYQYIQPEEIHVIYKGNSKSNLSDCIFVDIMHSTYQAKSRYVGGSCYIQWGSHNLSVNMSPPLLDCTIVEQHAVIQVFVVRRGKTLPDTQ